MTPNTSGAPSPAQRIAARISGAFDRFLAVEAASGFVLLLAAIAALVWANLVPGAHYENFWHTPLTLGIGASAISQPLHFWVNDCLMTLFFLVVGLEIRREIHDGALAGVRTASLPLAAAVGGIIVPAALFLALNPAEPQRDGWGIPTATDIAFAVGVLALLGRSIPRTLRVFLLALAVIDDVVGVIVIAAFYSNDIHPFGFWIAATGVLLTLVLQVVGIGRAWAYLIPGVIVWFGFVQSGVHPTLAGVVLGLLTPVTPMRAGKPPLRTVSRALAELAHLLHVPQAGAEAIRAPLNALKSAERELLPPVTRVQIALHTWVAYVIMPLFALANAGVDFRGVDLSDPGLRSISVGIVVALLFGKPIGIFGATWLAVRAGWCELPKGLSWRGVGIAGCLGGIGFTMSIFIANLAYPDAGFREAAKLGVLLGSVIAGSMGFAFGLSVYGRVAAEKFP